MNQSAKSFGAAAGSRRAATSIALSRVTRSDSLARKGTASVGTRSSGEKEIETPGTFSMATAMAKASAGSGPRSRSASVASTLPRRDARSADRLECLRKKSSCSSGGAFSNFDSMTSSAWPAEADHSIVAFFPLPWRTTCGCLRAEVHQAFHLSSATRPAIASFSSWKATFRPYESITRLSPAVGSAWTASESGAGFVSFSLRKCPSGSGIIPLAATPIGIAIPFAFSKSIRIESRAKFISTTLPGPRPGSAKTRPTSNGSHFSTFSSRAIPSRGTFASRNLNRPRSVGSDGLPG